MNIRGLSQALPRHASQRARAQQAAALVQLRRKAEEAERRALTADQLREENRLLRYELHEQRTYFQQQITDLKAALAKAVDQVKDLLAKVGLSRGRGIRQRKCLRTRLKPAP